jgi:RHS repeat-associated protein
MVTNGFALSTLPTTINSFYDPQVEFLELGVSYGPTTSWKLYGPDLNGRYGGLNGVGGYDADSPELNLFNPTISDFRGNILAYYNSAGGTNVWNAARPTGYGAVPGYRPVALANSANMPQSSAWRGRWPDITGYYHIGLRDLYPVSGGWLSSDSVWNERDPNWYTFAGGEPIMGFDADGRLATTVGNYTENAFTYGFTAADSIWNLGVATFATPQGDSPQQQSGLTDIALGLYGSPLQKMGLYDSSSASAVFTQDLPAALGSPMQNALMAYGGQPGVQPVEIDVAPADYNSPQTGYYVTPDGTAVPATGYRAIGGPNVTEAQNGVIAPRDYPGTYITFNNLAPLTQPDISSSLQLQPDYPPTHVAVFDTLQTIPSLTIPTEYHGAGLFPEPITTSYPAWGSGGFTQATTSEPIQGSAVIPIYSGSTVNSPPQVQLALPSPAPQPLLLQ